MTPLLSRRLLCGALLVGILGVPACSSGGGGRAAGPTTTVIPVANPLGPGEGYVQFGGERTAIDGVICATGVLDSDPEASVRVFGVYANFTLDGNLAAVSLTRYENHDVNAIPTVTDTALIRMQGDGEVRGLKAQRANIIGEKAWADVYDPRASTPLITRDGDRYSVTGSFGSPDGLEKGEVPVTGTIELRCPKVSASSTTIGATTTTSSTVAAPEPIGPGPTDALVDH